MISRNSVKYNEFISVDKKTYRSRYADDLQKETYKKVRPKSFLSNQRNCDHVYKWTTFFRRNLHRCAIDLLGINLHLYQAIILYLMGVSKSVVIIAVRAAAKSFIVALYACCICVLYPHSKIVIGSSTKGQSKLIITEKIEKELMPMSPVLRREIKKIKTNAQDIEIIFYNKSSIKVVAANDNARGNRSDRLIREEFRMIPKYVEDSIFSPFQIVRTAPYKTNPFYDSENADIAEEPSDIYISSSWMDNGHWMWDITDKVYKDMLKDKDSILLAFDESVVLKHGLKTFTQLKKEKEKQDPLTWKIEFENQRIKENTSAFFSYGLLNQNQKKLPVFYPRKTEDFLTKRKNPYEIPKQPGEIRIISVDMAFAVGKVNDNTIISCMRLLPEKNGYSHDDSEELLNVGYRRSVNYMESHQGGDTTKQALRIRQIFEDFKADYLVLDTRNGGLSVYDMLAHIMYDSERNAEYSPLKCMNDASIANRINIEGAKECIYAINATQKLNSDIAVDFKRVLRSKLIDFPVSFEIAKEEILPSIKEYNLSPDGYEQAFYEAPFFEIQAFISETIGLIYEKKAQTGAIVISEQGNNRKDRYTSVSYGNYFASELERDFLSRSSENEFEVFIN